MKQSSTTISEKSIASIETYISGILSNSKRKNCSAMAEELSSSHDTVYRALKEAAQNINHLQQKLLLQVQDFIDDPQVKTVIDDTLLAKQFAEIIEGLFNNYDPSSKTYVKSISIIVFGLSYKNIFFPLDFMFWFPRDIAQDKYLKKKELAMQLINKHRKLIGSKILIIDGLYAYEDFMRTLTCMGIRFLARMHANRVVEIENNKQQLKKHRALKPSKNAKAKMQIGKWKDMELYFTCVRMKVKNADPAFVFLVANWQESAKDYVAIYKERWPIEKFFRTSKQKLGLAQCQSTSIDKQKAHIFSVFVAFTRMAKKTLHSKLISVDDSINQLRRNKQRNIINSSFSAETLINHKGR